VQARLVVHPLRYDVRRHKLVFGITAVFLEKIAGWNELAEQG
jgi:hypothetical protein